MVNGIRLSKPVCERPEREERVRWGRGVWGRFDGCQYFVVPDAGVYGGEGDRGALVGPHGDYRGRSGVSLHQHTAAERMEMEMRKQGAKGNGNGNIRTTLMVV